MEKEQQMSFVKRYEQNVEDIRAVVAAAVKKAGSTAALCKIFRLRNETVRFWLEGITIPQRKSMAVIDLINAYVLRGN